MTINRKPVNRDFKKLTEEAPTIIETETICFGAQNLVLFQLVYDYLQRKINLMRIGNYIQAMHFY